MTELHVHTHDWSFGGQALALETVLRVLARFDEFHPAAVQSLAETAIPVPAKDGEKAA